MSPDDKKQAVINALTQTMGVVSKALRIVGVSRSAHYQWLEEDQDYAFAIQEIQDLAVDFAESKLFELIDGAEREVLSHNGKVMKIKDAPHPAATMFYLKTKGKKRGYVERQEITGEEGRPIIQIAANI